MAARTSKNDLTSSTNNKGEWEKPFESSVVGIHTALLHDGKVLLFTYPSKEGHEHDHAHNGNNGHHGHGSAESTGDSAILDPRTKKSERIVLERNIFCGGTSFLDNGNLLVAGGQYQTWYSFWDPPSRDLHVFDFEQKKWIRLKEGDEFIRMKARWYPTCVTLPDGKVLIASGRYSFYQINFWIFRFVNNTLQIFDPGTGSLGSPERIPFNIELYPLMHLLPSGKVFVHSERTTRLYDPKTSSWDTVGDKGQDLLEYETRYEYSRTNPGQGTSVLLPLLPSSSPSSSSANKDSSSYRSRVMLIGGAGSNSPNIRTDATATAEIIDLDAEEPRWEYTKPMKHPRVMPDSVILPDGKILVTNGSEKGKSDQAVNPVLETELFDPATETWESLRHMTVPRLYHATAVLLDDARVLVAGTDGEWNKPPYNKDQRNVEIFDPPYLFKGERPIIGKVNSVVRYGSEFEISIANSTGAADVNTAALIRPSSVTHSVNTEQRYVGLEIASRHNSTLKVKAPATSSIAPPGYYMLFILEKTGVPSVARWVKLT